MTKYLFTCLALLRFSLPAAAADPQQALKTLRTGLDASVFSSASLSPQNQLILTATDKYAAMPASDRFSKTSVVLMSWHMRLLPGAPANLTLSVRWRTGGELWLLKDSMPVKIDEWSDIRMPFAPDPPGTDRFFGYVGGQYMSGTTKTGGNMTAFNGRLGKTFLRGRCDAAALYGYSKMAESGLTTYGLTGRVLFPLNEKLGWNLGGSFTRSAPSAGEALNTVGVLAGLNFYLPGGSFDVTASLGNRSAYSLLLGYTLYLTRK